MPPEPPVVSPRTLAEAYSVLATLPHRPVAGGTDLLVQVTGELGEPPERVLDLWSLDEMRGISLDGGELVVGALSTYTEIRRSPDVAEQLPALADAAATIGAAQIQNRGTIGGNAANASPAGDTLPILLATDARIVLGSARGERTVAAVDFWTGYRQTALRSDELIVRIHFPLRPHRQVRFRKVGTRRAQAISKVVMALAWEPDDDGRWRSVRVALGSMAATPVRATATEALLEGSLPEAGVADRAAAALAGELSPIDDVRSTADYRRAVASRVLHRLVRDEGGW
ncbi:MAG TPA: xanthine dehydrogenase family protein subunit M [Candidatus Limnocylindrales bacterium]|nr:xanthine dehydrogenase family protein subunit M [Candidatus Limnocylindrales bacterium]